MSSTINAEGIQKEQQNKTQVCAIDVHIGVFFDGTNNNANKNTWKDWGQYLILCRSLVEEDHVLNNYIGGIDQKISNPAIFSAIFTESNISDDNSRRFIRAYIEGAGTNGFQAQNGYFDVVVNRGKAVRGLGFGLGSTGVVAKVSKAIKIIGDEIEGITCDRFVKIKSIHFYVFGFSRGSTCARLFSYIVSRSHDKSIGTLSKKGFFSINVENEFDNYLSGKYFKNGKVSFLTNEIYQSSVISIDFLGLYDTVSAIGFLKEYEENGAENVSKLHYVANLDRDFWDNFHNENAENYGLYSPSFDCVKSTCHICAIDEFRANFALTDIGNAANKDNNIELFLPGCHSDIGGGYFIGDDVERKTLEIHNDVQTMFYNGALPESAKLDQWNKLSSQLLIDMGWIENIERHELVKTKWDGEIEKYVTFDHQPPINSISNIYSNISLKFMLERLKSKIGDTLFSELFCRNGQVSNPISDRDPDDKTLKTIFEKIKPLINSSGRYFYIPSSALYKNLRKEFLHFTASDSLHSAGDIGNRPAQITVKTASGMIKRYITRYVYNGGRSQDNSIHYMSQYNELRRNGHVIR